MNANVAAFLAERAVDSPDQIAIRIPEVKRGSLIFKDTSFKELEKIVSNLSCRMSRVGVGKGTRVLVLANPGLELIAGVFAILRTGGVPVVIDPGMGLRNFLQCVRQSEPSAVFGIRKGLILSQLFRKSFRKVDTRISTKWISNQSGEQDSSEDFPTVNSAEGDPAAILFTSGSTGPAKGVCYEHGMFLAQIESIRNRFQIDVGEIDFPMLPVFALFNPALGMTTVVPPMNPSRPAKADAALQMRVMEEAGVTNSFGSPVLWNKIADEAEKTGAALDGMRRVLAAGAALPPSLVERLTRVVPNATIFSPYGATEALPLTVIEGGEIRKLAAATERGEGICVGRPIPGVEVMIIEVSQEVLTAVDLNALPDGSVGEIIATGTMVTKAYDNRPEATERAKIKDGNRIWHRMGDLGFLDANGRLWFRGRIAERVVAASGNVFDPECCEQIFNQHPGVYRSALVGLGKREKRVPGIVIQPHSNAFPKTADETGKWIEELKKLGSTSSATARINHFFFRKDLPVDVRHNAKINRIQLSREYSTHGLEQKA